MKKRKKPKKTDPRKELTAAGILLPPEELRKLKKRVQKTKSPT